MERIPPEVMLLDRGSLAAAVDVLCHAFADDPLMRYLFAVSTSSYQQSAQEMFRFSCEVRLLLGWSLFGCLDANGRLVGVAGVTLPEETPWPASLTAVYDELKACIGPRTTERIERYAEQAEGRRPAEPHYMLGVLGVHPDAQGAGYGRALVNAVQELSEAHPTSTGVWLDTENPRNVSIYERLGYHVLNQVQLDEVTIWLMFRPNRTKQ